MGLTLEVHSLLTAGTMLSPLVFLQSLLSYRLSRTHTHTTHTHYFPATPLSFYRIHTVHKARDVPAGSHCSTRRKLHEPNRN